MWKILLALVLLAAGFFAYRAWKSPAAPPSQAGTAGASGTTGGAVPPQASAGRALYQQGKYAEAVPRLIEEAGRASGDAAAELLGLAAECGIRTGKIDEALELWTRLQKDHPAHPATGRLSALLAEVLLARGNKEDARSMYAAAFKSLAADRSALIARMVELNQELLFSKKPTRDSIVHVVQSGENPTTIARKYGLEAGGLLRINGLKSATLYPNDKLKVPKGKFRIEVSKSRRQMLLFYEDAVARAYEIAVGKEGHDTPTGEFTIVKKEANPNWTKTTDDGRKIQVAYGQPGHMLGSRWMGFNEPHQDIGIHGTPKEEEGKIGGAVSKGCVRMRNAEVEELFDLAPKGTKATVRDE